MYAFLVVISIFFVVLCSNANLAFVGPIELCRCTYVGFAIVSWHCNVQDFSFINVEDINKSLKTFSLYQTL
jgi:hypothetical protein